MSTPAQFFILRGSADNAESLSSQFSEIQQYGATRMAKSAEDARVKILGSVATGIGEHTYSIWQLVPVETIIKKSKPLEFETTITPAQPLPAPPTEVKP